VSKPEAARRLRYQAEGSPDALPSGDGPEPAASGSRGVRVRLAEVELLEA
jgi:hypothetical protein